MGVWGRLIRTCSARRRSDWHPNKPQASGRVAPSAAMAERMQTPGAGVMQHRTCSWPVCAGFVLDFGPMFLLRVAAAFLATALFSSADFDAARQC